jgi:peptide methionine sulfoxide reductase msrA/msrB
MPFLPRLPRPLAHLLRHVVTLTLTTTGLFACRSPAEPASPMERPVIKDDRVYRRPDDATLRKTLTPLAFRVAREDATEPPFRNAFWDNHNDGLYVDVTSGEPLFSSRDKFDSGTGWPSFVRPVDPARVVEKTDRSHGMVRVEARSRAGDIHLGHVFDDGPRPTGLRYCINSASLRFIAVKDLAGEGYGAYLPLFGGAPTKVDDLGAAQCNVDGTGGCASSFVTITLPAAADASALQKKPGVVEVKQTSAGIEVTFDPAQTSEAALR